MASAVGDDDGLPSSRTETTELVVPKVNSNGFRHGTPFLVAAGLFLHFCLVRLKLWGLYMRFGSPGPGKLGPG